MNSCDGFKLVAYYVGLWLILAGIFVWRVAEHVPPQPHFLVEVY